jgi:hypothetical protein
MKMLPFREAHLDEASSLVARSYAGMRRMIGSLPDRYEDPGTLRPMLSRLCATASGVAAVEHDELHGFVLGLHPEDWRGQRTAYVPEWAHGRGRGDLSDFLERMYAAMAAEWVSAGYTWHLITAATDADDAMYALRWMGFGMCGLDAVLDLEHRDPTLPPGPLKGTRSSRRARRPRDRCASGGRVAPLHGRAASLRAKARLGGALPARVAAGSHRRRLAGRARRTCRGHNGRGPRWRRPLPVAAERGYGGNTARLNRAVRA